MKDKSLDIWLIVLFGISGMAVLLLGWLWSTLESERVTATLTGSVGLFVASTRALMLKRSSGGADDEPTGIKVNRLPTQ